MPDEFAARRWGRFLGPQALAGAQRQPLVATLVGIAQLAVFAEVISSHSEAGLALAGFLMVVGGWLLAAPFAFFLAFEAAILVAIAGNVVGLPVITQLGQVASLAAIALISHLGATSLSSVQRAADQERRVRELSFLLDAAQALGSTLEVEVILRSAVSATARGVSRAGAGRRPRASFHAAQGDNLVISVEDEEEGLRAQGFTYPIARNQAAVGAIRTGGTAIVRPDHLTGPLLQLAQRQGWQVMAMAPVRSGTELYGLLTATSGSGAAFDRHELRLLEVLAHMTSLAIGNAENLRRERVHLERTEALERTKSELLNLVSHELRGPLTVVRGYVDMLLDGTLGEVSDRPRSILPIVADKITEMELLVEQTLEASRIDDSRLLLQRERVDLRDIVQRAIRTVSRTGSERHELRLTTGPAPVMVDGDPVRLQTVFVNILDNAIKYSPEGGVVSVEIKVMMGAARVGISDPGIGIAEKDLAGLFTRFGRLVTPENSNISGTGLGLYLSRQLARMHGGDIAVHSRPGHGSTFTIELPLALPQAGEPPSGRAGTG